jgi:hypothetical protein
VIILKSQTQPGPNQVGGTTRRNNVIPKRGKHYRLERGKGYGQANWWVLTLLGEEVAGGLLYADAERIFNQCEDYLKKEVTDE